MKNKMLKEEAKVSDRYQVHIPKKIREKLEIRRGDRILFGLKEGKLTIDVRKMPEDPVSVIDGILAGEDLGELRTRAAGHLLKHKLGLKD